MSSASSEETSPGPHDVPETEALLYFSGLRGPNRPGPKLIFRTSSDVFVLPEGPEAYRRLMLLRPVYEHHRLGVDDWWALIRSECVKLLDQRNIRHSSIDLARFSWLEKKDHEEDEDDEGEAVYTTPITIWVGVLPDTLSGELAFYSSQDILGLLRGHGITDVEVAYRESVSRPSSGPELFAPVSHFDPLKAVVDPLTTALGLPIAGLKTLKSQGTMGFYFRVGDEWYAVTARHVLFPRDEGNDEYIYKAGPRKDVVLMGTAAFVSFVEKIQAHITNLKRTVEIWERRVVRLTPTSQGGGPNAQQAEGELAEIGPELIKTQAAINELTKFSTKVNDEWTKPANRVIGHVIWAPPISIATAPHLYSQDVCVVKLNKKKFIQNFKGNVLDLGPEIDAAKFIDLMYPRVDMASDFKYPDDRLLKLRAILSKEEIRTTTNTDHEGNRTRYVIKRGLTTLTTIGRLNGFESHRRTYLGNTTLDSVEAAIFPYDNDSGPFSRGGDSGSLIVDAFGRFVALLTGGTGPTDSSDITYGTPIHWLWEVIKARFEGANLYFDDQALSR
ncbi:hypothetical protein BC827DRAFT_1228401 [Russula dissimulans]|nr:hypothetical protein BC827DRAFT_1228401 [Russula dissimulans]